MFIFALTNFADMVKLVDMPDLGSGAARRVGSSPIIRTKPLNLKKLRGFLFEVVKPIEFSIKFAIARNGCYN